ncbi:hypothetical protein [Halovulum sp. GXIMD14793]
MIRRSLISRLLAFLMVFGLALGPAPAPQKAFPPDLAMFLASGGQLSALCLPGRHTDVPSHDCGHCVQCPSSSAGFPPPVDWADEAVAGLQTLVTSGADQIAPPPPIYRPRGRAPPVLG